MYKSFTIPAIFWHLTAICLVGRAASASELVGLFSPTNISISTNYGERGAKYLGLASLNNMRIFFEPHEAGSTDFQSKVDDFRKKQMLAIYCHQNIAVYLKDSKWLWLELSPVHDLNKSWNDLNKRYAWEDISKPINRESTWGRTSDEALRKISESFEQIRRDNFAEEKKASEILGLSPSRMDYSNLVTLIVKATQFKDDVAINFRVELAIAKVKNDWAKNFNDYSRWKGWEPEPSLKPEGYEKTPPPATIYFKKYLTEDNLCDEKILK